MKLAVTITFLTFLQLLSSSLKAQKSYTPIIETCDCRFKMDADFIARAPEALRSSFVPFAGVDSSYKTRCGYLIVPENRAIRSSKMIRLPFILVESKNPNKKKDPLLFTSGGPGNSSLSWAGSAIKSGLINDRDCIAFEQRGTRFAIPHLRSFELDAAIKTSYRKNQNKDSAIIAGLKRYKKTLDERGIDVNGYSSDATVSDIHNLIKVLKIDSVNLYGGSYSGGLMTAVLQKDPTRIRSLILDSPLPMFTPIDEDEPANFNEALSILFKHVEQDSTDKASYSNLHQRFLRYFNGIATKTFYLPYLEAGTRDSVNIAYTKNELLAEIMSAMGDDKRKAVAAIVVDMINGKHAPYVKNYLDALFRKNQAPDGMRIAVYCADQSAYHSEAVIQQLYKTLPYLTGYRINDVYKAMCDCWKIPPVSPVTKQPYYSNKPILMADGEMDPNCRPLYMKRINHYMPNGQSFLFLGRGHGVGSKDWVAMMQQFLNSPYQKVRPPSATIIPYQ